METPKTVEAYYHWLFKSEMKVAILSVIAATIVTWFSLPWIYGIIGTTIYVLILIKFYYDRKSALKEQLKKLKDIH